MAFNVGAVVAEVKADTSNFQAGINNAKNEASKLDGSLSKVGDTISTIAKQSAIFTGVVIAGLALAGKQALNVTAQFEQYDVAFTTLLKDRVKAQQVLKQIEEDAKKTPFELAPLVKANQLLISAGISAEDARIDIINLGNAISATGGGEAELSRLSVNLQQIQAVGKASALDIKQFAFAGINIYELLSESMGKSVAEVKEMDISYEDLSKALADASKEGGLFEGAMEAQSSTFNGLMSTLSDTINLGLKDILKGSGVFDFLRESLKNLIPLLENVVVPKAIDFFQKLANVFTLVKYAFDKKIDVGEMIGYKDWEGFETIIRYLDLFEGVLEKLGEWIGNNQELFFTFLKGFAIGLGALLIIGSIAIAVGLLTNPLTLLVVAITALYTAWETNFMGIRDITMNAVNFYMFIFNEILIPFILAFAEFFTETWNFLKDDYSKLWEIMSVYTKYAWDFIYGVLSFGLALFTHDWKKAFQIIFSVTQLAWGEIKGLFSSALSYIGNWAGSVFRELVRPFEDAWNRIRDLVNKIKDSLDFTKRHSPSVVDIVSKGVKEVNRAMAGLEFSTAITPQVAGAVVSNANGTNVTSVNIDMAGAIISDELGAMRMGEKIGDQIIRKLQLNVRF